MELCVSITDGKTRVGVADMSVLVLVCVEVPDEMVAGTGSVTTDVAVDEALESPSLEVEVPDAPERPLIEVLVDKLAGSVDVIVGLSISVVDKPACDENEALVGAVVLFSVTGLEVESTVGDVDGPCGVCMVAVGISETPEKGL